MLTKRKRNISRARKQSVGNTDSIKILTAIKQSVLHKDAGPVTHIFRGIRNIKRKEEFIRILHKYGHVAYVRRENEFRHFRGRDDLDLGEYSANKFDEIKEKIEQCLGIKKPEKRPPVIREIDNPKNRRKTPHDEGIKRKPMRATKYAK